MYSSTNSAPDRAGCRRGGFTLIEVMFATAIMGMVVATVFMILQSSSDAYQNQAVHLELEGRARDVLAAIARDLRSAGPGTLTTGSPSVAVTVGAEYHDLQFGVCSGYDLRTKTVQFADMVRYRWMPDLTDPANGRDDDSDGLVDEGVIERTDPRGVATKICDNVAFEGLEFVCDAHDTVAVHLTLQKRDAKFLLISYETDVVTALRN